MGSGGATAHVLVEAWRRLGAGQSFGDWLRSSRKLIINGGGEHRALPAYAASGKPLIPISVMRWARGQRLDQTLLDLLLPDCLKILGQAPDSLPVMVVSGDVLLRLPAQLPKLPVADVLGLGLWQTPERAHGFGVFITTRQRPNDLSQFLQKPAAAQLRALPNDQIYLVDTGAWLFSAQAIEVLLERCGWVAQQGAFAGGRVQACGLYRDFGPALGAHPSVQNPLINRLSCAVVPLPGADIYRFSSSQEMIESVSRMQSVELDETKLGLMGAKRHPDQYIQNTQFDYLLSREQNQALWLENSHVPATWELASNHVVTGAPANQWPLKLEAGACLDFVPVGETDYCVRAYGIRDTFSGTVEAATTLWFDWPLADWFRARGISLEKAGLVAGLDIQDAPLFPVLAAKAMDPQFLHWLFAARPAANAGFSALWQSSRRLSARQLITEINWRRHTEQRAKLRNGCLLPMLRNYRYSVFFKLDLESTARLFATGDQPLPKLDMDAGDGQEPLQQVHDQMFRAAVLRHRGTADWEQYESKAFALLQEMIVRDAQLSPVLPHSNVQEDQIVWGRSPVRLDLAGGWTDTPPYCLEYGGKVLNMAVDLNSQPPIQVFGKLGAEPALVLRSIDLGVEQRIHTYEELDTYARPGSEFALAKAALALAGFLPRFHATGGAPSLKDQLLEQFGGGIEVSMLSAVPKGSGLGTSSILAATLLATLSDLCGLNWDRNVLFIRTLALEQMLTTGGGWQDQAGAIFRGIKLVETGPGLSQKPTLRWLPPHLFEREYANKTVLLYYTGITRLAKNILQEIVRGIFLNSPSHLRIIGEIGLNAELTYQAIQQCDYNDLTACIRRSWTLNQRLDSGTNPPEVQRILTPVEDYLAATKLLGAGGGGFLLMFAKDEEAARRIQKTLTAQPPNPRARFVQLSLSDTGLQITRS